MLLELDVVVDVDAGLFPDRELVGPFGQGFENRLVQLLEEFTPGTTEVFHRPCV